MTYVTKKQKGEFFGRKEIIHFSLSKINGDSTRIISINIKWGKS